MSKNEEKIEYTAEEQREIEKILDHISIETQGHLPSNDMSDNADTDLKENDSDLETEFSESHNIDEKYTEVPDDLEIGSLPDGSEQEDYSDQADMSEDLQMDTEELTGTSNDILDITDIIQEIPEEPLEQVPLKQVSLEQAQTELDLSEQIPAEELSTELTEESAIEDISFPPETEEEQSGEPFEPEFIEPKKADKKPPESEEEEPEFDLSMISEDLDQVQSREKSPVEEFELQAEEESNAVAAEKESLADDSVLKDFELSDFNLEELRPETPQAPPADIETEDLNTSDLDIAKFPGGEEISERKMPDENTLPDDDLSGIDFSSTDHDDLLDLASLPEEKIPAASKVQSGAADMDLSADLDEIDGLLEKGKPSAAVPDSGFSEPIEDLSAPVRETKETHDEIDLSDSELKKLNKVMRFFHPNLVKVIKNAILNDLLQPDELRKLVDMLLKSKREDDVKDFLEKRLNTKIDTSKQEGGRKRRVISARPEYTKEARERQTKLLKASGIFIAVVAVISTISLLSYQYIYKPIMAKRNIEEGVRLIKKPGVPVLEKQRDYKKAEDIFTYVDEHYQKDYLYGYHEYAKAYFKNKEYDYAVEKLNKAYNLKPGNVDTLNNLGYFYSKIPETKFSQLKPELKGFYYNKVKPIGPVEKQIDVAIDFYKKALNLDPKNITAMYGIGNAYTYLGEPLKARQYFENIIAIDKNSVIGHSGLLNLFIEKDALGEVVAIHSKLSNDKNLSELPSALLAKLASYYLGKKKTDDTNIRIDYGIDSPAVKDFNDNPYPAVKNVLDALAERDIDYPPLFLQNARLSKEENNLNLMKRNLLLAIEKAPTYFAAHTLLAEYYYKTKDPVEAYKSCKKAVQAFLSPPDFTQEDFYSETENIGAAYAIMGNIFYYADKLKFMFGDELAEENTEEKDDKFANYTIAQDKYEKAIAEKIKSGEVYYNLGYIYYIKGQYEKALSTWLNLYEDFVAKPELIFALGNAFYHQSNLEASKGEYLKIISVFENTADNIKHVYIDREEHIKLFQTLSSAYNNLGAVYQIHNSENKSHLSYWKAIEFAKKIERENEFARVNLARGFKAGKENAIPILDENIAPDIYAEK